jgi:hypothetical protein
MQRIQFSHYAYHTDDRCFGQIVSGTFVPIKVKFLQLSLGRLWVGNLPIFLIDALGIVIVTYKHIHHDII